MFLKTLFSPRPRNYTLLQPVHHSPTEFAMQTSKADKVVTTAADGDVAAGNLDADSRRLAEMGYTQDMQRNFSVISLLGVAFSLANSWFGISASLITGIKSGGTVLTIYGIPWIAFVSTCVAVTLSELASAMPNAGGNTSGPASSPPKDTPHSPPTSLDGSPGPAPSSPAPRPQALALRGRLRSHQPLLLPLQLRRQSPAHRSHRNAVHLTHLLRGDPHHVPAAAPTHANAHFVFANFVNSTGWPSDSLAFLVGLINPNWVFACLDSATHLAEEVSHPERSIPIAILSTVAIGFTTSWFYCIAMFFSVHDLAPILSSPTGVPILALFHQALQNKPGAIALESLILITGIGCQIACHTWQSRLCWSFARDNGLPCSRFLAKIHPVLDVPLNAHAVSCTIVALLGLLYLGSSTAFNSMVSACIVLLYSSYVVPVIALLYKGRRNITHGPFWLGKLGCFCNWVVLAWTAFCLVVYSFPSVYPVTPGNMNYVCVVYAVVGAIIAVDWVTRGKRRFGGQHQEVEEEHYTD
ncbi:putative choline transport protein [Aspergillus nomiae NRRL 13137]|uniref:Putative choline transport protein n=1 Tax=Aspergillus nomiae NRRL (strain ATCC 15546 / NRRL 13137 / CBS 260.88 / M93) TaxID=1509407 RepID=A0A0L1JGQ8_ASPN3|nr:putative choline transport protein [Aspergillus nomiae NRRL 13137]KNG90907.1 putative choline transport protein [Aspergillus nomiae NRRL 13137]